MSLTHNPEFLNAEGNAKHPGPIMPLRIFMRVLELLNDSRRYELIALISYLCDTYDTAFAAFLSWIIKGLSSSESSGIPPFSAADLELIRVVDKPDTQLCRVRKSPL